jgi:hypothetical protein
MTRKIAAFAFLAIAPLGAKAPQQPVPITTVERVNFAPGGVIRVTGATGELNVEGWDEPTVQVTFTRTVYADASPKDRESATQELKKIKVTAERQGNGELLVSTKYPYRNPVSRLAHGKTGAELNYRVMVPRDSHLIIHHDRGDVVLYNLTGDIEATVNIGDILAQIPDAAKDTIDAKCKIGDVYTDFDGQYRNPFGLGERFAAPSQTGGHKLYLRSGMGGIKIQEISNGAR